MNSAVIEREISRTCKRERDISIYTEHGSFTEERKSGMRDSFIASVAYFIKACPENMN